ncbi:hypothetical protein PSU4_40050 [Pseudonocardia sulfidoxydans NBRC 16205]|uniref:Uncharacterized protein n=1 Tax=Pseudonocardia sulfidoxydans NBRC 16205 TaxID=1223511 RepID=A0A511DJS2_9PSEU|nr:hypothetical protein PSU4_40050 [Pseudonocardia sulfidoxydans NBRC 16205]
MQVVIIEAVAAWRARFGQTVHSRDGGSPVPFVAGFVAGLWTSARSGGLQPSAWEDRRTAGLRTEPVAPALRDPRR